MGWPFVVMRRRRINEVAIMVLIMMEIVEELQQRCRQVRAGVGTDFSRNVSSSPWIDASSDEVVS